jgi:YesN/AraC family two-component response regulator
VQSAARSVRLQVVAYLVKPCDADELLGVVEQAIANYRAYRVVNANRQLLETWARDLAQIEEVQRSSPGGRTASAEAYLSLTLRNLLSVLMDLKKFTEALSQQPGKEGVLQQVALHRALQETIDVLEKTKQSFKSKELGELRRRLETLLHTPPTGGMKADI